MTRQQALERVAELSRLGFDLYDWQREALTAWMENDQRGVIEAVTGAGKTRVGIAAARLALSQGMEVLVVAPTRELVAQWRAQLESLLGVSVGIAGGGSNDWFDEFDVIVATIHTAKNNRDRVAVYQRLLIADECHRYAADGWSLALTEDYEWRIGLTATYARPDGLHETALDPYFHGVIFTLWYDRALADGLIAPFEIGFVAVRLTPSEEHEYYQIEEKRESFYRNLIRFFDTPPTPQKLMETVNVWADSPGFESHQRVARGYRSVLGERRRILAESKAKLEALRTLGEPVLDAQGTLVFTDTQDSARRAAQALAEAGSSALAVFSDLQQDERERAINAFREQQVSALVAPRILDEGIDVPEADLGILVAMNRSRRQLVQRLGRVLRRKADGRPARILVLCALGTHEDPRWVDLANLDHLEEVLGFARKLRYFTLEHDEVELRSFLRGGAGGAQLELSGSQTPRPDVWEELPDGSADDGTLGPDAVTRSPDTPAPPAQAPAPDHTQLEWFLRAAIQHGFLQPGTELFCNRERVRDFGRILLSESGQLHVQATGLTMNLVGATRIVVGYRLPAAAVLRSWVTAQGLLLQEVWEQLVELLEGADRSAREEPGDDGESDVRGRRAEPQVPEAPTDPSSHDTPAADTEARTSTFSPSGHGPRDSDPSGASKPPVPDQVEAPNAVEVRSLGTLTEIVIRTAGGEEITVRLDPATAGALGAQLLSAAHLPLSSPFRVEGSRSTHE